MPMLVMQCPDGTVAGYTCQRSADDGKCVLVSPHCPPAHAADSSGNNDTSTSSSPRHTIHGGPTRVPPVPYNRSAHNASMTAFYSSSHPTFNCSRRQCGASIMPIVRTCPDGSHAYPLCAWVAERRHCGYLDPSCSYPGWRSDSESIDGSTAVDVLYAEGVLGGGIDGTVARQVCERGGCMLPMYVKVCPDGSTVRPHCVWSNFNGTELCLANQPVCPTVAAAEMNSEVRVAENGAVLVGASFVAAVLAAMLGLLVL